MLSRPVGQVDGQMSPLGGGMPQLGQKDISLNAVAGNTTLLVANFARGILNRTGPGAGFTDTWPTADEFIAAMDNPQVGDSFDFVYRNGVAQAMTFAAGTGIVAGTGTLNVAASLTRFYLHTLLSTKRTTTKSATTTNTTLTLTNVRNEDIKDIMPGMGVSGTGIGAAALVTGVTEGANGVGTVTVSVASTATADNVGVTFFPRIRLDSIGSMTS